MREAKEAWKNNGQKTLLFVSASGHGLTEEGKVVLLYNELSKKGRPMSFKLEETLRIASEEHAQYLYVVVLFDCCRSASDIVS